MPRYYVQYGVVVNSPDPFGAAMRAFWRMVRGKHSQVFEVSELHGDTLGKSFRVDLETDSFMEEPKG
jgi:hypothetical protein